MEETLGLAICYTVLYVKNIQKNIELETKYEGILPMLWIDVVLSRPFKHNISQYAQLVVNITPGSTTN